MPSVEDICNRALGECGARNTISSIDEGTPEAKQCNLYFTAVRDQVLRAAHWNFAKRFAALALFKTAGSTGEWTPDWPAMPWKFAYHYPQQALYVRHLYPAAMRFEVAADVDEGGNHIRVVNTNLEKAHVVFTQIVASPTAWDPHFVEAVTAALAGKLVFPLTGNLQLKRDLFQIANGIILTARASDANEGLTIQEILPDWIRVRGVSVTEDEFYIAPYGPLFGI